MNVNDDGVNEVLQALAHKGIDVFLENGTLKARARKGGLDGEAVALIKASKAQLIAYLVQAAGAAPPPVVALAPDAAPLPLSYAQHSLWLMDRLEGGSAHFNMATPLRTGAGFDPALAEQALQRIVARHEPLRTVFAGQGEQAHQVVRDDVPLALARTDLRHLAQAETERAVEALVLAEAAAPFDLARDPMLRARFVALGDGSGVLLLTMHHIAADGWSTRILLREFVAHYEALADGRDPAPAPLPLRYADYARWQRAALAGPALAPQLRYWQQQLAGLPQVHGMPLDHPRPARQSFQGARHRFGVDRATVDGLKQLAQQGRATLFMVLHAALSVLLARHSGATDIVIGTPVANRPQRELEDLIGLFINPLVLRVDASGNPSFAAFLEQVRQTHLAALANADVPFDHLVDHLRPQRSAQYTPLFQILLSMGVDGGEALQPIAVGPTHMTPLAVDTVGAKYELLFDASETDEGLALHIDYNLALFDAASVARLAGHFRQLLGAIAANAQTGIGELAMLTPDERRYLVHTLNPASAAQAAPVCLHELFEAQVARRPDAVALVTATETLSYAQLNARANRLARRLRARGVTPDTLVGLYLGRGAAMMAAVLATLKAGGAYVPLDPAQPQARLAAIIEDSALDVLLTESDLLAAAGALVPAAYAIDGDEGGGDDGDGGNLPRPDGLDAASLAYVIYTSGSTGRPKGVLIEHRGAVNVARHQQTLFGAGPASRVLGFSSLGFDAATFEWLMALAGGAALHLCAERERQDPTALGAFLASHRISHATLPPAVLAHLAPAQADALEVLILAGEAPSDTVVRPWLERCRVFNAYGPTEATIWSSTAELRAGAAITLGAPVAHTELHVLDGRLNPVPLGVAGELHIGGVGLARGYVGNPQLNAERFIPSPFRSEGLGSRLYRSGDLVRRNGDGELVFLGRLDDQVKLRGLRIELGEIESQLRLHDAVKEAVVLAREDVPGNKRLVAYVTASPGSDGAGLAGTLKDYLESRLPDYMVPPQLLVLDAIPLTRNGKIDRHVLPEPGVATPGQVHVAPGTATEITLAAIWTGLLDLAPGQVGANDNFFALGGHSLLVIKLLGAMREAGLHADAHAIFSQPTLAALAASLDQASAPTPAPVIPPNLIPAGCSAITPAMLPLVALTQDEIDLIVAQVPGGAANVQDIYPLAPLQEALLFAHLRHAAADPYILMVALAVPDRLRLEALQEAIGAIVRRHDVLRTAVLVDGLARPVQVVLHEAAPRIGELALGAHADVDSLMRAWLERPHGMDLARAPLLDVDTVFDPAGARWLLLVRLHHITSDHFGLDLIRAELDALLAGRGGQLPAPVPYRLFVARALDAARDSGAAAYFRATLGDFEEPSAPFQLLDVHRDGSGIAEASKMLAPELATRLRLAARTAGVSAATLFHAAWALVVAGCSGRSDVVFGTVLSGRMLDAAQARHMLGMFINTLPLRLRLADTSAAELVAATDSALRALLAHEQAPLALAQQCSGLDSAQPLFTALLNYRHSHPAGRSMLADGVTVLHTRDRTNYPLVASIDDFGDDFALTLQTDAGIDPHRLVAYLEQAAAGLATALEAGATEPLLDAGLLSDAERRLLLSEHGVAKASFAVDACLHEAFELRAATAGARIAICCDGAELSYAELNARANRLAHHLRSLGVGPDQLVGLYAERGPDLLVGLLAILKAGGAYLPLDPDYPAGRLAAMVQDSGTALLVTQTTLLERTDAFAPAATPVALDGGFEDCPDTNPERLPGQGTASLAYVIYTSGSTGMPKGAMIEHGHVMRLFAACAARFEFQADDVWTLFHSFAFDFSVWEIWGALLHGARLVVVPRATAVSPPDFHALLRRERVTMLSQTPRAFGALIEADGEAGAPLALRHVVFGGEALNLAMLRPWIERHGDAQPQLANMYGITETTVHVTYRRVLRDDVLQAGNASLIGQPLPDLCTLVLTPERHLAPPGVAGELHIGGAGLARGYLNRPDLSAERFIDNPFHDPAHPGSSARLYRTGDLARQLPDGALVYLGRIDDQVKVRGFRIEPGEIESRLRQHEAVAQAAVMAREDRAGDQRLVAYVSATPGAGATYGRADLAARLLAHLRRSLPDYMVPSHLMVLDALPLTANGKIDRRALPQPELAAGAGADAVAPLQSDTERRLATVWAEVLQIDPARIGADANFFALGGHSLLLMALMAALRAAGMAADARTIYEADSLRALAAAIDEAGAGPCATQAWCVPANPIPAGCTRITPDMLPLVDLSQDQIDAVVARVPGGAANLQDIYPLAPLQEGIHFFHLLHRHNDPYIVPALFAVDGADRFAALRAALERVVARHDVLRTAVLSDGLPQPLQVVWRRAPLDIVYIELDPGRDALDQMRARLLQAQTMDVTRAPMLRLVAAQDPASARILVQVQVHHLIEDVTSSMVLTAEVQAHLARHEEQLPAPLQYREFVAHALRQAQEQDGAAYFSNALGTVTEPTAPFGLLDVQGDGSDVVEARRQLDPALAARLRQGARQRKLSPATLFHAAWALVVAACSGRDDVVFGTVLSGRMGGGADARRMLGMFINTLPLRLTLAGTSVSGLIGQTEAALRDLLGHEQAALALAQSCSGVAPGMPLFTALLNYRHLDAGSGALYEPQGVAGCNGLTLIEARERSNYPVLASVDDDGDAFWLGTQVRAGLRPEAVIGYLEQALAALLAAWDNDPGQAALALHVIPEAERRQLLGQWDAAPVAFPAELCIHELFEAQAARTPAQPAASCNGETLTYGELNARANRLAHHLRALGAGPELLVGLCMERGLPMLVALLAVLKSGAAYVPLDPAYPQQRLNGMVVDSGMTLLLTEKRVLAQAGQLADGRALTLVTLDDDATGALLAACPESIPARLPGQGPASLAYVIYTSGSTGAPKGVMVEHRSVVNFLHAMAQAPGMEPHDVLLQLTSLSFDIAVLELILPLTVGARVVIADADSARSPARLADLMVQHAVTVMQATPSTWRMLIEHGWPREVRGLKVLCGGEALPPDLARTLLGHAGEVWNLYGPTETTIWSSVHRLDAADPAPLIGRPIANTQLHVLDERGKPVPIGVAGELYIGGAGLARGYLKRAQLTAERFVDNPFRGADGGGERLFRTGDLVRCQPDGSLACLGRLDQQVKLRGFRIELGEIEACLLQHAGVEQAVVVARADGGAEPRLVAYVTRPQHAAQESGDLLREHLAQTLPVHMLPAQFVVLERLPLTPNGKIDRLALPEPGAGAALPGLVAPHSATERALAQIWAGLLDVREEHVGATDNFFALGGHSLLAVRLVAEVRRRLGAEIDVRDVFASASLAALAALVDASAAARRPPMTAVERGGRPPLSFAQQRLWFLDRFDGSVQYNMPAAWRVEGAFDVSLAGLALGHIVARHETLRTTFDSSGHHAWQVVNPATPFALEVLDLRALAPAARAGRIDELVRADAGRPFDLTRDLMLRASYLDCGPDDGVLLINMHHIASDGWSVQVLEREFLARYQALSEGSAAPLPALPIQYADYAHWQRQWLAGEVLARQLGYWERQLADLPPVHGLALDRPRPARQTFDGARHTVRLDPATLDALRGLALRQRATLFMVLHATLGVLLARHANSTDVVIGTPVANRLQHELEGLIGFFANTLVLRLDAGGNPRFCDLLEQVRTVNLDAQAYQDLPFELLVERLKPARSAQYGPLFQIMLSLELAGTEHGSAAPAGPIRFTALDSLQVSAKVDLAFHAAAGSDGLALSIDYNTDLFDAATAARLARHWRNLLRAAAADAEAPIHALPMLDEDERDHLLHALNATAVPFPLHLCMHEVFEAQVAATPDAVALAWEDGQLSYAALNTRANRLARYLRAARRVEPDTLVGLCLRRGPDMIVGILAILKAGAAYVPLDPDYPPARLAYMLADGDLRTVLTEERVLASLPLGDGIALCLDAARTRALVAQHGHANLAVGETGVRPQHLAYVIYTSGSTGNPKGVMIEHHSLVNLACSIRRRCALQPDDGVLQFSTINFDLSVADVFGALASGCRLVLRGDDWLESTARFWSECAANKVTILDLPTAYWHELAADGGTEVAACVRRINIGGEQVNPAMVGQWRRKPAAARITLLNVYGPTEATVDTTVAELVDGVSHIGRPMENARLYVLDRAMALAPPGAPGELYIGGEGVARGYLNLPQLTAERFVADPFCPDGVGRLYKTGDLVRYLSDGNLDYLGRSDEQVKIRGFRVEPGEIEAHLAMQPEVAMAVVLARADGGGDRRLVAYLTLQQDCSEPAAALARTRQALSASLPEYMVPSLFMLLDAIPQTPNGKVDKAALPLPDAGALLAVYRAPSTDSERRLQVIWAGLLQLSAGQVSTDADFFALGGHSLLLLRLVASVAEEFGVQMEIRKLFELMTIAQLAGFIDGVTELNQIRLGFQAMPNQTITEVDI